MGDDDSVRVPEGLTTDGLLGRRYLARFIDMTLLWLLSFAVLQITGLGLLYIGVLLAMWVAYGGIMESSPWQATVGKRILGLRVYDTQGDRLDIARAGARTLVKDGPFLILAFVPGGRLLALMWVLAHVAVVYRSPLSQAIHDRVVGTWVAAPETTVQLRIT